MSKQRRLRDIKGDWFDPKKRKALNDESKKQNGPDIFDTELDKKYEDETKGK